MDVANPINLEIPWPPSVNHYWRHTARGAFLTPKARRYRTDVQASVMNQLGSPGVMSGRLRVSIVARAPDRRIRDLDNLLKGSLDALDHAGVYGDDSQIHHLTIRWGDPIKLGLLLVSVEALPCD